MTDQQASAEARARDLLKRLDVTVRESFPFVETGDIKDVLRELLAEVDALSARLAQAEQERDEALGVAYLMAGQKEQAEARLREYEKALKKCWACGQTSGEIRRIVEAALGNVKHG
jgi:phosphoribosyl-AMP cyclohydrolase